MSDIQDVIKVFYDHGFYIRKISDVKFSIHKHRKPEVIVEYLKDSQYMMYKKYCRNLDSWKFYDYLLDDYHVDIHYKKCCDFDRTINLKVKHIIIAKPTMRMFVKHKYMVHNLESYKTLNFIYHDSLNEILKLVEIFPSRRDDMIRDKMIPNTIKYVLMACNGDGEKLLCGENWNTNPHYLSKLISDFMKYKRRLKAEYLENGNLNLYLKIV